MADIYFLRHGQPDWYPAPDHLAVLEPGLTQLGHLQAQRAAKALADINFDYCFVSSLRRARETAEPLSHLTGKDFRILPWLRELQSGSAPGITPQEGEEYFARWRNSPLNSKWEGPSGGETYHQLIARIDQGLDELLAELGFTYKMDGPYRLWQAPKADIKLLFVGHSFASSVAMNHLLGIAHSPFDGERFRQSWCAYARLTSYYVGQGFFWRVRTIEERSHVADLKTEDG